jgi:coenzyme F420-0:L-glutamate ligase/coenzyme F420-1:gamma-L-glutamate ligase
LLLAARADGLDGCWLCGPLFAGDEARRALELPEAWEPQGMVVLGEAADSPARRGRKGVDEVTQWR